MPSGRAPKTSLDWDPGPTEGVLQELIQGSGYVRAEYTARLLLLARGIARCRPGRVLDIGCGHGALSLALAEAQGVRVTGFDILPSRVNSVRSRQRARPGVDANKLNLLVADAEGGLPFKDATFDVAILTEVLEHVRDPPGLLGEAGRVLTDGGRLFITSPHTGALPYRILRRMPRALVRVLAEKLTIQELHPGILERTPSHPDEHRHEGFTIDELEAMARTRSLTLKEGYTYRIPLPDKVMRLVPRSLAGGLAEAGAKPLPLGLEVYCEFVRADRVAQAGAGRRAPEAEDGQV